VFRLELDAVTATRSKSGPVRDSKCYSRFPRIFEHQWLDGEHESDHRAVSAAARPSGAGPKPDNEPGARRAPNSTTGLPSAKSKFADQMRITNTNTTHIIPQLSLNAFHPLIQNIMTQNKLNSRIPLDLRQPNDACTAGF
jgi:hypothetical protein